MIKVDAYRRAGLNPILVQPFPSNKKEKTFPTDVWPNIHRARTVVIGISQLTAIRVLTFYDYKIIIGTVTQRKQYMSDQQLLTMREAAAELGVAVSSIYAMMDRAKIDFVIVGRTQRGLNRRIPRSEIDRLKPLYQVPTKSEK